MCTKYINLPLRLQRHREASMMQQLSSITSWYDIVLLIEVRWTILWEHHALHTYNNTTSNIKKHQLYFSIVFCRVSRVRIRVCIDQMLHPSLWYWRMNVGIKISPALWRASPRGENRQRSLFYFLPMLFFPMKSPLLMNSCHVVKVEEEYTQALLLLG